jgi:hypothetical protein
MGQESQTAPNTSNTAIEVLKGKKVISACSSLQNFSVEFESGLGLKIDAVDVDGEPAVAISVVEAGTLPKSADAVCSVDWRWIYGSSACQFSIKNSALRFDLDPVGPLMVSAGAWQGKPFLSFQPFKPPAK